MIQLGSRLGSLRIRRVSAEREGVDCFCSLTFCISLSLSLSLPNPFGSDVAASTVMELFDRRQDVTRSTVTGRDFRSTAMELWSLENKIDGEMNDEQWYKGIKVSVDCSLGTPVTVDRSLW